ncbi:hypothetical protein, partial [Lacticaseibacillus paracasei]|uniref:hypothetical protein n=1 Tax=Lacticaseibacillus paracasei TaxID=1597 RepID=UPI00321AED81
RLANTVSGYADKFVQKFGLNLQSTIWLSFSKKTTIKILIVEGRVTRLICTTGCHDVLNETHFE